MNEITVMISGMILLMSPAAYDQSASASKTIHSAVAVNATKPESKYGMDIPNHFAALVFNNAGDIDTARSTDPDGRLVTINGTIRVSLDGDLVQLGTFNDGMKQCGALSNDPSQYNADIRSSIKDLPRMQDLVANPLLADGTYPLNGHFDKIDPKRVASWFEIPVGVLYAKHSPNPEDDAVVFPPVHQKAMVAPEVRWHIPAGKADCILVTSFDGLSRIDIAFKSGNPVSVGYENKADMASGVVMPGIGFDFEVLYSLYEYPPAMPPLPFSPSLLRHRPNMEVASAVKPGRARKSAKTTPQKALSIFNPTTGVNCGPATIPSGG